MIIPAITLPWIGTRTFAIAYGISAHTLRADSNRASYGALGFAILYTAMGSWVVVPMGKFSQACLVGVDRISRALNN